MKFLLLGCSIFFHIFLNAQINYFNKSYIESAYYYGSVLPQHKYISYLLQDHIQAFHLNIGRNTDGSEYWHQYLNYPRLGIGYYFSNLGNNKVFGYLNATYGTIAIKTFKNHYLFNIEHVLSSGIGFVTKYYNLNHNSFNIAIGSNTNFFLQYSVVFSIKLKANSELYAGSCFTHISAASIILPNHGINMALLKVGYRYNIEQIELKEFNNYCNNLQKKHLFTIVFASGRKQYSRFVKENYWVYAITPEYTYKILPIFGIGGGVDFYYDTYVKAYYNNKGYKAKLNQIFHSTFHFNLELIMGKLSFLVQPGIYIYKKFDFYNTSSYKFGYRYQLTKNLTAGIILKAHWLAQADVLEFGFGYTFYQ